MAEKLYNNINDKSKALEKARALKKSGHTVGDINNKELGYGRWPDKSGKVVDWKLKNGGGTSLSWVQADTRKVAKQRQNNNRKGRIEATESKTEAAVRKEARSLFKDLVKGSTFTDSKGKTYTIQQWEDAAVEEHRRETKLAIKNAKNPEHFNTKSSLGHSAGTNTNLAVESSTAFYPQDSLENSTQRDVVTPGDQIKIKNAGMAISPEDAARQHLGTGPTVDNPTSAETRDRIIRGEDPNVVKQQAQKQNLQRLGINPTRAALFAAAQAPLWLSLPASAAGATLDVQNALKEGTKESWVNAGMGVGGGLLDLVSAGLLIAPIPGARPASVALDQVAARMSQAQMLFSYSSRAQSMKKELEDMEIN